MNNVRSELIHILRCFLNSNYNYSINTDIDELYNLSNSLGVGSIVGYTLDKSNIKNTKFNNSVFKALNKYERLSNTRNELDKLLDDKYQYLYIKGLTISKYYEEPYLRYSSDIDVIVEKEKYEEIYNLLLSNGYKLIRRDYQETTLVSPNNIVIDLHRYYTLGDNKFEELFNDCFNETHELDINYNYVFNLIHCLKHFKAGILSYKFFIDLYYLRKNIDINVTDELLKKVNLRKFNDSVNHYLDCLLENKEYSENDYKLEEFIFSYSIDLGNKNRVLINSFGKSRLSYVLSRVFIPFDIISEEYPVVKKHKILLPVYYIKRIVRAVNGKRKSYVFNEIKNNSTTNKDEIEKMHDFINNIIG